MVADLLRGSPRLMSVTLLIADENRIRTLTLNRPEAPSMPSTKPCMTPRRRR